MEVTTKMVAIDSNWWRGIQRLLSSRKGATDYDILRIYFAPIFRRNPIGQFSKIVYEVAPSGSFQISGEQTKTDKKTSYFVAYLSPNINESMTQAR